MTKKSRKATYIQKWRAKHKLLQVWLSRDDYDKLQKLAASKGKTVKELFLDFVSASLNFINESSKLKQEINKVRNNAFHEGYKKAINDVNEILWQLKEFPYIFKIQDNKLVLVKKVLVPPLPRRLPWTR